MTTNSASQFTPLVTRRAEHLMDQVVRLQDIGSSEDLLPMVVLRRPDGEIVSRDSRLTEVNSETTDDN